MELRRYVKQNARHALEGNWARAVGVLMIWVSIYVIFSLLRGMTALLAGIPEFADVFGTSGYYMDDAPVLSLPSLVMEVGFLLVTLVVGAPLLLGIRHWYYALVGGVLQELSSIFSFFGGGRLFCHSVWLRINLAVRMTVWGVLFFCVPMGVCTVARMLGQRGSAALSMLLYVLGGMLVLLTCIFYVVHINRYFLAPYLLAANPNMGVGEAIRSSVRGMRGGRTEVFLLSLSFVPWALLCVFLVPLLYVAPYYSTARALYARYFIERAQRNGRLQQPKADAEAEPFDLVQSEQPNTAFTKPFDDKPSDEPREETPTDAPKPFA